MSQRTLLTGPEFSDLESRAFDRCQEIADLHPESILYVTQQSHPREPTRERWDEHGPSAALRITTFDDLVADFVKHDQYKGRVTHIDRPLLARLVELGIEGIEDQANPIGTGDRFPSAGLVAEAELLYTRLEYAGLLSPEAMEQRLVEEGLPERGAYVAELAEVIEDAREELLADSLRETYGTERLHHAATAATSLDTVFPAVDAVILSGFTSFQTLERELLTRIIETWPTIALLPSHHDSATPAGIDRATTRALAAYDRLGFTREFHAESPETPMPRRQIARSFYRHPTQSPDRQAIDPDQLNVTIGTPATKPAEIRTIAREIRSRIANGTDPAALGVILPSPGEYADQVREIFATYEIPVSLHTEIPLQDTAVGDLTQTICQLASEPRTVDSVVTLLTNPLVTVSHEDGTLDHRTLVRTAARAETRRLATTLDHLDETIAATIESIVDDIAALADVSVDALPGRVAAIFDRLGVSAALDGDPPLSGSRQQRAQQAKERLDRVLETVAITAPQADTDMGTGVDRLERALHGESIRVREGSPDDSVVICNLAQAVPHEFEQLYILGVTGTHFPADPEQTGFTQPIYESHPDFELTETSREAQYYFGLLLGDDTPLHLSIPQRALDGDPYVEADVITELRRFLDLDTLTDADRDVPPGCLEDIHWTIGDVIRKTTVEEGSAVIDRARAVETIDGQGQDRLKAGIACAAARSSPELTPYDGQLTAETVSQIHGEAIREPYSASRLETYAACGFKYYMRRVLGIEAPESITREPDPGVRGSYIHDVLEHYYLSLQSKAGEPIDPGGDFEARQERLLSIARDRLEASFDGYAETAFQESWLRSVLAGLGTPDTNPYYGPTGDQDDGDGTPVARGLFYRFLEHESNELAKTTARPTWFEARVGTPHDAGTPVQTDPAHIQTPQGTVPVHGLIDRVETVPGTDPTHLVVRDYKTGSNIPGEKATLLGLSFQLPLYALIAEDGLADVETVGGAYYQVSPPSSVSSRKGLVTSQEMASYHGSDDPGTPLLRHSYPAFETHAAFRRFLTETTPQRLGELVTGIEEGRFHPTVLDPSDAGCRYCDYAHVCDVRPHRRGAVMDAIDAADLVAYIPPKARDQAIEDILEVT